MRASGQRIAVLPARASRPLSGERIVEDVPSEVLLSDATCSVVDTETFDSVNSNLMRIQDVLIIELKRGKSAIGRDEINQADGYIQDFLGSGALDGMPVDADAKLTR